MFEEFLHLLSDPAHWAFEAVADGVFFVIGFLVARVPFAHWLNKHNKEHHHQENI